MAQSINKFPWEEFLKVGAFVKASDSEFVFYVGHKKTLENSISSKNQTNFSLVTLEFFSNQYMQLYFAQKFVFSPSEVIELINSVSCNATNLVKRQQFSPPQFNQFEIQYQNMTGKINRGEIEKAVPMVISSVNQRPNTDDLIHWLKQVVSGPKNLTPYGFWNEEEGCLGSTPEFLFHLKNNTIYSVALAGTCPRNEMEKRTPLLKDEKERHEHQLVIDDISTQLNKMGTVRIGETQILELPTLQHLITAIEVNCKNENPLELIKLLHPTSALGVFPRGYGFTWMMEFEAQTQRKYFGSPLCFKTQENEFLCLVAIRNIQWTKNSMFVSAGCGIVKDSSLDREWNEINNKLSSIFDLLGI